MSIFKTTMGFVLAAVLTACGGGGGDAGTTSKGTGSSTTTTGSSTSSSGTSTAASPTALVSILDNSTNTAVTTIGAFGSYSAKVVIADASGNPVPSSVVTFGLSSALATLSPNTALTDANGIATVRVFPTSGQAAGAALLTAVTTLGAVNVTGTTGFASSGGYASTTTVTVSIKNGGATVSGIGLSGNFQAQARVLDGSGAPVVSKVVTFSESSGLATFSPVTFQTDTSGYATVNISPAVGSVAGASTVTATTVISGTAISGSTTMSSTGGLNANGTIVAGVYSGSTLTTTIASSGGYSASAKLVDGTGNPATGKLVTFSLGSGLVTLGSSTALTGSDGVATVSIAPTSGSAAGAVQLQASANISSSPISSTYDFYSTGNLTSSGTILASIYAGINQVNVIGVGGSYTASAKVLDSSGNVASGKLVTFSLGSNLATLSANTAVTGLDGVASVNIFPTPGAAAGGVALTATTTLTSASISGTLNFTSNGGQNANGTLVAGIYTLSSATTNPVTNISNASAFYANAKLVNASGVVVPNTLVSFGLSSGLATLGGSTALTNASGVASVIISPTSGATSGALTLSASATVNGATIPATYDFSSSGASTGSQVKVTIQGSCANNILLTAIDLTTTYNVCAKLLDATSSPIINKLVTFSVNSSLATLAQTTALTDSNGIATVVVAPTAASSTAGAVAVTASAVISGVSVSGALEFSTTRGSNASPSIVSSIVGASPAFQVYTSVTSSTGVWAQAKVTDASGNAVSGRLVSFGLSTALATLSPTTALTDANGIARVGISAVSGVVGAGTLTSSASVSGVAVSSTSDFAYTGDTVVLSSIIPGSPTISSGGNTSLSLTASLSSGGAITTPANVTLTASCGNINGSNGSIGLTTTGSGSLVATYTAVQPNGNPCIGVVQIGATSGTASASQQITVSSPVASTVNYVSATLNQIYIGGAGNPTISTLTYKVLTATGSPSQNTLVDFSIQSNPGGVALDRNSAYTDSNGLVTATITSGTIPGPLKVRATIDGSTTYTDSQNLTVASGPPSQRFMSVSVSTFNIEGQTIDGTPTTISVRLADRQGNPVVNGTIVNFTAGGGQIPGSCATAIDLSGHSSCSVQWISQNYRPANGRVAILAYTAGTKDYLDNDYSNSYTVNDTLYEMGDIFRDDNENGIYDSGEFRISLGGNFNSSQSAQYPWSTATCPQFGEPYPSISGTCTGLLPTLVRQQVIVMNSSSSPAMPAFAISGHSSISFNLTSVDHTNLPMPAGTTVSASVVSTILSTSSCAVKSTTPASVANISPGTNPAANIFSSHFISTSACGAGDQIGVTITSPGLLATTYFVTL